MAGFWSIGVVEYWSNVRNEYQEKIAFNPILHYSNAPRIILSSAALNSEQALLSWTFGRNKKVLASFQCCAIFRDS
jgi:hypothetical protein